MNDREACDAVDDTDEVVDLVVDVIRRAISSHAALCGLSQRLADIEARLDALDRRLA